MTDEHLVTRARRLSAELLSGSEPRWAHVQGVARRAEQLAAGLDETERDIVVAAAWLHDIGYAPGLVVTRLHSLDGACHLAVLGLPSVVCGLVAFHTGARYEAEERGLLAELLRFATPPEPLLDVLTTADLSVGPDGQPVSPTDRIAEILQRYEPQDPVHTAVKRSTADLLAVADRVPIK